MLKKAGFVTAAIAAVTLLSGGIASAATGGHHHGVGDEGQVGLVNLNNTDILHNLNLTLGVCDNDVNVLGVQVPIRHALDGLNVPILSPGKNTAQGASPYNCASGGIASGGSVQHN